MQRGGQSPGEALWDSIYWRVMGLALVLALGLHLFLSPTRRNDLIADAAFLLWTLVLYLAGRTKPEHQRTVRLVHGVGVLFILTLYALLPETSVPQAYKPLTYMMLAFFPIYHASAISGTRGLLSALGLALTGAALTFNQPWHYFLAVLYWGLAGMVGLGYHRVARELERERRMLETLALTDPLTGLGNRRALERDFARYQALAARQGVNLVFALWDLDNLKEVNDKEGHEAGDALIRQFARALTENTRPADVHYRIGGDEFVGLYLDLKDPDALIERIQAQAPPASVGWVEAQTLDLENAYRAADQAMYARKKQTPVQE